MRRSGRKKETQRPKSLARRSRATKERQPQRPGAAEPQPKGISTQRRMRGTQFARIHRPPPAPHPPPDVLGAEGIRYVAANLFAEPARGEDAELRAPVASAFRKSVLLDHVGSSNKFDAT